MTQINSSVTGMPATTAATQQQPYAAGPEQEAQSPYVAGPETTMVYAPTASIEDFAALGFPEEELRALADMQATPEELGMLYGDVVAQLQELEAAGGMPADAGEQTMPPAQVSDEVPVAEPGAADAAQGAVEPGWNDEWNTKFATLLQDNGITGQAYLMVLSSLRQTGMSEEQLGGLYEQLTSTPEGAQELAMIAEQAQAAGGSMHVMNAGMLALAAGIGGGAYAVAKSPGNLTKVLTRIAMDPKATSQQVKVATQVLSGQKTQASMQALVKIRGAGIPVSAAPAAGAATSSSNAAAVEMLKSQAKSTSRLAHPLRKASVNGAARHLTPSTRMSAKEALKAGVMMTTKTGSDAAKAGAAAASAKGGGAAAKVAATGAASAAKGAGTLARVGGIASKALGPIGLVAAAGFGAWGISQTVKAEGGFGKESAKMTGNVAGGLTGAVAGAAAGAALGSVVPGVGNLVGLAVGGIAGGILGAMGGEGIGGALHDLFN